MHLHAITGSYNQNSAKSEVNLRPEIQNNELKEYGFHEGGNCTTSAFSYLESLVSFLLYCIGAKCCFQLQSCTYLLGKNTGRRLIEVFKVLTFPSMTFPFK